MVRIGAHILSIVALFTFVDFNVFSQTTAKTNPEKVLISITDIDFFWQAYDEWKSEAHSAPNRLAEILDREYLKKGSPGLQDFIPHRIVSAEALAETILKDPQYYEGVRANTKKIESLVPDIRKAFGRLRGIYNDAIFPPVYFVVGRRNSGGTDSTNGLIIGSEMFADTGSRIQITDVVSIVVHELIHYQQQTHGTDLITAVMNEGAADFIAELITGHQTDEDIKPYGDSHEQELWMRFQEDTKTNNLKVWLYNGADEKRSGPPDLGYYVGYKICQSFYEISPDKAMALKIVIAMKNPKAVIEQSEYARRFQ
jgi:hypothetical protein